MDVLTDVLLAARSRPALSARTELSGRWGLRFDGPIGGFHVVAEGSCWLRMDGAAPIPLATGDVVYLPTGAPHILSDSPTTLASPWRPGVDLAPRGGPGPRTVMLCGYYPLDATGPSPLLAALPRVVHVPADGPQGALPASLALLAREAERPGPGADVVMDRLIDLMLVYLLRAWLERQSPGAGGWLRALADPQVGRALELVHADPGRRWTVQSLGHAVGLSRAAFARRFVELVGEPPLAYLTRWRMTVAARLLREGDLPLGAVADRVGYDSEFAFARAFKRAYGEPPGRWRASVRAS